MNKGVEPAVPAGSVFLPLRSSLVLLFLVSSCSGSEGNVADTDGTDAGGTDATEVFVDVYQGPVLSHAEILAPGPYGVGLLKLDLVDGSRPTPATETFEGATTRPLPTLVWYPSSTVPELPLKEQNDAAPQVEGGPWPLIMYNHGFMSNQRENAEIAALLATRGYVTAAADFPLTSSGAPGQAYTGDVLNQPEDVRFIADHLFSLSEDPTHPLHGMIRPGEFAVMGISLGGLTCLLTAFHPDYADARVTAVSVAAAPGCYLPGDFYDSVSMPTLFVSGTMDEIIYYKENGPPNFAAAQPPKYHVTIEGGTHTALAAMAVGMSSLYENPDVIGCLALKSIDSVSAESLAEMAEDFGGKDYETVLSQCPAPCANAGAYPPALGAARQVELVTLSFAAFTEAYTGDQQAYRNYLQKILGPNNDEVTVEYELAP